MCVRTRITIWMKEPSTRRVNVVMYYIKQVCFDPQVIIRWWFTAIQNLLLSLLILSLGSDMEPATKVVICKTTW